MAAIDNGFSNLNGAIPVIFSKQTGLAYRQNSKVLELITNDFWQGNL